MNMLMERKGISLWDDERQFSMMLLPPENDRIKDESTKHGGINSICLPLKSLIQNFWKLQIW